MRDCPQGTGAGLGGSHICSVCVSLSEAARFNGAEPHRTLQGESCWGSEIPRTHHSWGNEGPSPALPPPHKAGRGLCRGKGPGGFAFACWGQLGRRGRACFLRCVSGRRLPIPGVYQGQGAVTSDLYLEKQRELDSAFLMRGQGSDRGHSQRGGCLHGSTVPRPVGLAAKQEVRGARWGPRMCV